MLSQTAHRDICDKEEYDQGYVLQEGLPMGQMDRFTETSAVHFRIEYDQKQGQDREEALEYEGCYGGASPPYSCHHRGSEYGLCKSKSGSCRLGCKGQEAYVEKREILVHHQSGTDRVKKLKNA